MTPAYIELITQTAHSSIPTLLSAHHKTFLGMRLKAFSKSIKAKKSVFFSDINFSYSWRAMNMVSMVPLPAALPSFILLMALQISSGDT